ncbi:MAG: NAD-dependent epimerase [Cyclobacteriaceae bacterium]|nr:NAD-dependent epimerase [Cyclobacteriaceae bacterium]MCH8515298.1 NAD-dependent epimerase [Cyclobacteriaceae bacterium]
MSQKVLVTGTAGFIGFHLALALVKKGYEVVGMDVINDYYDVNLKYARLAQLGIEKKVIEYGKKVSGHPSISFIQLQLEDKEGVDRLFHNEKFDFVVNLAAQAGVRYSLTNPHAYLQSNIIGFLNILEACRHNPVKHLVYASSSSVYGLNESIPFEESQHTDHPVSLYAASKKSNEMMAHTYSHLYQIPTTGLRFFTVYGPWGRPDMALFLFTKAMKEGRSIDVFNHGNMQRDFTYIDDIVEGIIQSMVHQPVSGSDEFDPLNPNPSLSSAPFRVFNIGNNSPVPLMDYVREVEDALGKRAEINYLPLQAGDVPSTFASTDYLSKITGYKPSTPIKVGVKRFIEWYEEFYDEN